MARFILLTISNGRFYNSTNGGNGYECKDHEDAWKRLCATYPPGKGSYEPVGVMELHDAKASGWTVNKTRAEFDAWCAKTKAMWWAPITQAVAQDNPPPGPRKPKPVVCPEVWNTSKVNADTAMAAVRDMCKGVS